MNLIRHSPAFSGQVSSIFNLKKGDLFLDLTLGDGTHTQEALQAGAKVVSFDVDLEAVNRAVNFIGNNYQPIIVSQKMQKIIPTDFSWIIINANFKDLGDIAAKLNLSKFDAILADLGTSQYQLSAKQRGFSFQSDGPLDMRLDPTLKVTAADLVNALSEKELEQLFLIADEAWAKSIARAIAKTRLITPITTTGQLATLVASVKRPVVGRINPATKIFMALRMAVNLERESLREMLDVLPKVAKSGATIGVISFHSGEDRLVKHSFREKTKQGIYRVINLKPIKPNINELQTNKKIRSAQLRLVQKI